MEPGIAGGEGQTLPYQARHNFINAGFSADDLAFQMEMHKIYGDN